MKNVFLLIMFLVFSISQAQNEQDETMYSGILQKQIDTLNLSGEKKDAFTKISTSYFDKMMYTREKESSKIAKFKELKKLSEEKDKELKALLNSKEFSLYKEMQKDNRKMLKDKYGQN